MTYVRTRREHKSRGLVDHSGKVPKATGAAVKQHLEVRFMNGLILCRHRTSRTRVVEATVS
jgi:hypothetical protein